MAVDTKGTQSGSDVSSPRRVMVGTNVLVATALVVAIVVVAQLIAYKSHSRWDMTSSGVNSLSEGTENLLRNLDQNVRITSLYFETDREDEDQSRYRRSAQDLLDLYEATNRTKVRAEWINPLKDHQKFGRLQARLREKTGFKEELAAYEERLARYTDEIDGKLRLLIQSELDQMAGMGTSIGASSAPTAVARVEEAVRQLSAVVEDTREAIDSVSLADNPQLTLATTELKSFYARILKSLKNIIQFGNAEAMRNPEMEAAQADFLRKAGNRYADVVADLEGETTKLGDLEPLKLDDILAGLAPTANPILVETDDDAKVVDFGTIWPPVHQRGGGRAGFKSRAFKGEEKLTSAILRATHKEQTAVIFVRYGGSPLFLGGFMPGQPPAPYSAMRQQLEDANFIVREWDLKAKDTVPEIDPTPTRTLFVVFKPTPQQRGPMGRPGQEPPFTESHKQALLGALGDNARAVFIAGWYPGPFGPIPSTYEYNEYLKDKWGITVDTSALLIETMNTAPGRYQVARRDFYNMDDVGVGRHDIVKGELMREVGLPWCSPLELAESVPEGVEHFPLVTQPGRDGVWGVKNIQKYEEQMRGRDYLTKVDEDLEGPFLLAVAATKGDAKIVVVSSRDFATDAVAFARELSMTPRGLAIRSRNPGNVPLLINSLHWLNDDTEFMNIGKPIDAGVLEASVGTVKAVQALTVFVWPALAMMGGCAVWWVRRR